MSNETISGLYLSTFATMPLTDGRKYRCAVHGVTTKDNPYIGDAISRTPHILVSLYEQPRYYCLLCYAEWLEKHIPILLEEPQP